MDFRESCVINSNPGVLFPKADFKDLDGQLSYASRLMAGLLDYKVMIDEQTLPVEHMGKNPLCMMQYYQILSACRVPDFEHDKWYCYPPDKPGAPHHITVMYNKNVFEVPVYGQDNQPMTSGQIRQQLEAVVQLGTVSGPPVGLMTMEHRDNWAQVYKRLVQDKTNKESLKSIEKSIMVLCLDGPNPATNDTRTQSGNQMLHGSGAAHHSANRWFDKTIQFIVGREGNSGLNYEHTSAEGPPVVHLMDHCLDYIASGKDFQPAVGITPPTMLKFNIVPEVQSSFNKAINNTDKMVENLDLKVFVFEEFGKNFPKSQKMSPDSFIQNALQLAYYRHHKHPIGSYESGSIRMFQEGRTDTIRSCSSESRAFTMAMLDNSVSRQKKAELLQKAVESHKRYTNDTISGKGIDRHLLGLKLIAQENNIELHPLYSDVAFGLSGTWRISTSQVPAKSESVLFFGPVVSDGYGFCYNPQEKRILFGISSFKDNKVTTTAPHMAELVQKSLLDMREVLLAAVRSNL